MLPFLHFSEMNENKGKRGPRGSSLKNAVVMKRDVFCLIAQLNT